MQHKDDDSPLRSISRPDKPVVNPGTNWCLPEEIKLKFSVPQSCSQAELGCSCWALLIPQASPLNRVEVEKLSAQCCRRTKGETEEVDRYLTRKTQGREKAHGFCNCPWDLQPVFLLLPGQLQHNSNLIVLPTSLPRSRMDLFICMEQRSSLIDVELCQAGRLCRQARQPCPKYKMENFWGKADRHLGRPMTMEGHNLRIGWHAFLRWKQM